MSVIKRLFSFPFYPALFCLYMPLKFYADNSTFLLFDEVYRVIFILMISALLVFCLSYFFNKSFHTSALLCCIFMFGIGLIDMSKLNAVIWFVFLLLILFVTLKKPVYPWMSLLLNFFFVFLLVNLVITLAYHKFNEDSKYTRRIDSIKFEHEQTEFNELKVGSLTIKPNIVHIILDGYSNNSVLKSVYDWDNSEFLESLDSNGFQIMHNAYTPYNQTLPTLSSMFIGRYWETQGQDFINRRHWSKLITEGPLYRQLIRNDYAYLFVESGYFQSPELAVVSTIDPVPVVLTDFEQTYYKRTLFRFFLRAYQEFIQKISQREHSRNYLFLENAFSNELFIDQNKSFFLFQHMLTPHPPFNIGSNGKEGIEFSDFLTISDGSHITRGNPEMIKRYKQGYINKLKYTNDRLLGLLEKIIAKVDDNLIVIVHGDHGGGAHFDQENISNTCVSERYQPFFAIYSNIGSIRRAFENFENTAYNITNTYRLIVSNITELEILPLDNKSWFIPWSDLNNFIPVSVPKKFECNY